MHHRPFRFRLWDDDNKTFVPPAEFALTGDGRLMLLASGQVITLGQSDRYRVVEATGVTDTHGQAIFEGDVVKNPDGRRFKVYWPDGDGTGFYIDRNVPEGFAFAKLEDVFDEVEVVGNVFVIQERI